MIVPRKTMRGSPSEPALGLRPYGTVHRSDTRHPPGHEPDTTLPQLVIALPNPLICRYQLRLNTSLESVPCTKCENHTNADNQRDDDISYHVDNLSSWSYSG